MPLRAEPTSVRAARRFVCERLVALGHDDVTPVAELLVSELVTNAVLHARTDISVSVADAGDRVRVGVRDESPHRPRRRRHSIDSGTGRGLLLLEQMAAAWGVDPDGPGKVVWFELPRDEGELDLDAWED